MDNLTPEQRKKNMRNIRSTGTKPEKIIMNELKRERIFFKCYDKNIIGKPDIVFSKRKIAVFIDSDFWHGHPKRFIMPKTNVKYWSEKILKNKARDKKITNRLRKNDWSVLHIWEHDVNHRLDLCIRKIIKKIEERTGL